jgi:hypothetical protein
MRNREISLQDGRRKLQDLNKTSILSPELRSMITGQSGGQSVAPGNDGWQDLGNGVRIREKQR